MQPVTKTHFAIVKAPQIEASPRLNDSTLSTIKCQFYVAEGSSIPTGLTVNLDNGDLCIARVENPVLQHQGGGVYTLDLEPRYDVTRSQMENCHLTLIADLGRGKSWEFSLELVLGYGVGNTHHKNWSGVRMSDNFPCASMNW